jgi:hypothetical protein
VEQFFGRSALSRVNDFFKYKLAYSQERGRGEGLKGPLYPNSQLGKEQIPSLLVKNALPKTASSKFY